MSGTLAPEPSVPGELSYAQARHCQSIAKHVADALEPLLVAMRALERTETRYLQHWPTAQAEARFTTEMQPYFDDVRKVVDQMLPGLST